MQQLCGLADVISAAHYPENENDQNFRHGALKPENILWFMPPDKKGLGTLKIGDWGLAKQHATVTELRINKTTTEWGTRRYEPPEEATGLVANLNVPEQSMRRRSRLYDTWAMGCIALGFLIWLMYGLEELRRFNKSLRADNLDHDVPRFYQPGRLNGRSGSICRVNDVVTQWMDHMARDPICEPNNTALPLGNYISR